MNKLTILKTGNFWIDNGIVGLYRTLKKLQDNSASLTLDRDGLTIDIITSEETALENLLNAAKDIIVESYLKQTKAAGWIYRNERFEVYRKNDFKMHLKSFFTGKTPRTEGALCVPDAKDSDVGNAGKKMDEETYQAFLAFKEANSPVIIDDRKYPLTGKGFLNSQPKYEIGEAFKLDFLREGKKICSFSGQRVKDADVITGMDYPFLTGKSGELNFASHLNNKPLISALYAFVALFSFSTLYYQLTSGLKSYFVLYDSDLVELDKFINSIEFDVEQLKNTDYYNFAVSVVGTQYSAESLFNFIVSIYKQVKGKLGKDFRNDIYTKSIFTLSNDGNIFRQVTDYTSLTALFNIFDQFEKGDGQSNFFEPFLNMIRFFSKKIKSAPPEYDTSWRDRLCRDILAFRSINRTVEWFLGEVKLKEENGSIAALDRILIIYNNNLTIMKPEMVDLCKSLGNRIGRYCRERQDKGLLFSLRNAKNRTEFLNILAESQFRTEVSYSEEFFKSLPDSPQWEEYKALVSIFAMNSFLFKEKQPLNDQPQS